MMFAPGESLRGPVSSVGVRIFRVMDGDPHGAEVLLSSSLTLFDRTGRATEFSHFRPDGTPQRRSVYEYDGDGRLAASVEYDEESSPARRSVYSYDEHGRLRDRVIYDIGGSVEGHILSAYDDAGGRTVETRWQRGGEATPAGSHTPAEGVFIPSTADGPGVYRTTTTYDGDGRAVEASSYDAGGAVRNRSVYAYDAEGRKVKETLSAAGESAPAETVYSYDSQGRVKEIARYEGGALQGAVTYTYDPHGNVAEESRHAPGGALSRRKLYVREYDAQGNWVKETMTRLRPGSPAAGRELVVVTYRSIEYQQPESSAARG